ncbi:glycosyltransferase [Halorubrum ezzemoulense]|uniref:Glycosyl transferase n=1 Tax=Halorubrum ezzemoulense TaxID=337243 RepID=A0A256K1R7_HALEZ|nr:glycosyltransferase [Halorubrum ezzemoulense]MDB2260395.1 glycosyltransferase [Halorubrum ezzemoulense]MDB2267212.1 glycosyltransferase [Halorubrum ezzemoulense]MDB2274565.1 glycosyltransferase [Halorubrum ezzemoulense]OYR75104.1 glycosyl transferase [Halorubrum ezzemoulense]
MTAPEPTASPGNSTPVSVLLPTVRWTDACDEVAAQLRGSEALGGEASGAADDDADADELLVICDSPDDPVADRQGDLPPRVRIVIAGEPEGCSGKANAIAAGMAAAANDRIAWTDDDFRHPPDWLATLDADYDRQGPTTEVPVFVGLDPLARLFEPAYVIGGTLAVFAAGVAWGGAVIFEREDLRAGEAAFRRDLLRTVSDDGTLTDHLDVASVDRTRYVRAGGSARDSLERFVRFLTITRYHAPGATAFNAAFGVSMAALCLFAPVAGVTLVTALAGAAYARFGIRRATFLLAAPGVLIAPPLMAYAFARRTFVWGGRRYRWRSLFDVEVEPI